MPQLVVFASFGLQVVHAPSRPYPKINLMSSPLPADNLGDKNRLDNYLTRKPHEVAQPLAEGKPIDLEKASKNHFFLRRTQQITSQTTNTYEDQSGAVAVSQTTTRTSISESMLSVSKANFTKMISNVIDKVWTFFYGG
jgi:hypothetical protein